MDLSQSMLSLQRKSHLEENLITKLGLEKGKEAERVSTIDYEQQCTVL
jgi:hypothetical protein